jgi:RimJ/RimL family protein N-acetyltransferase
MRFIGVKAIGFHRRIKGEHITLRLLRLMDLPLLRSTLRPALLREFGAEAPQSFGALTSLWKWLKTSFQILYLIEKKSACARHIVGMVGLYDLDVGSRAYLSAFLFDPRDRGQGFGRESVCLFLENLEKVGVARSIYVEVLRRNSTSLRFFRKMGFKIQTTHSNCLLMAKNLDIELGSREPHDRKSSRFFPEGSGTQISAERPRK